MNTILYEKNRNIIKKAIKKDLGLTFLEIIILEQLKHLNKEKIDAVELKRQLNIDNTPISIQINNLCSIGLFKKSRDEHDERRIYLHHIDFDKIAKIIEQYHSIVTNILKINN
ncbi:MarR family transcriptional regulator [Staphylococcus sp. GSSP0090]|nr:MarR family transcriptional regulator [Staphylococcus sp. GSSP0090]